MAKKRINRPPYPPTSQTRVKHHTLNPTRRRPEERKKRNAKNMQRPTLIPQSLAKQRNESTDTTKSQCRIQQLRVHRHPPKPKPTSKRTTSPCGPCPIYPPYSPSLPLTHSRFPIPSEAHFPLSKNRLPSRLALGLPHSLEGMS